MSALNNSNFSFQSIHQPSVVEQILETVKQSIMRGELRPGQRLPSESEISQQMGVGRSAVREAMKILEALGVVTIQQGNGTFISEKPSPKMLNPLMFAIMLGAGMEIEFYELRYTTQVGYCELAAEKATAEDWEAIEAAAALLEDYASSEHIDFQTLCNLDLEFHNAILAATHSPMIIKIGRTVEEIFFNSIYNHMSGSGKIVEHHGIVMDAMRDGSPQVIREAVATSLAYWREAVEQFTHADRA